MSKLKTSEEWNKLIPYLKVIDPDGWDRKNYDYSWKEELITFGEFERRLMWSTSQKSIDVSNSDLECCGICGYTGIEIAQWVNINSNKPGDDVSSIDEYWCENCSQHHDLQYIVDFDTFCNSTLEDEEE